MRRRSREEGERGEGQREQTTTLLKQLFQRFIETLPLNILWNNNNILIIIVEWSGEIGASLFCALVWRVVIDMSEISLLLIIRRSMICPVLQLILFHLE